jgi:hypothetical protein
MDEAKLRAWWWHRQGLDGSLRGKSPAEVLERSGWARSVGGAGPYLTLHSRAGTSRETADAAVAKVQIHELPAARGCTYVLPASDFALGLKVGASFTEKDMGTASKLGVTEREVEKLCDAVLRALDGDPLNPEQIRAATGTAARSLGDEGKKRGMITTLPLALGRLQAMGKIRRVPVNGRLDQQRYRYVAWKGNPLDKFKTSVEDAYTELARRFFRWVGPARVKEFQGFAGLGVKVSKEAVAPLELVPAADGSDLMLLPEDTEPFRRFSAPSSPQYALVSSLDTLWLIRHDLESVLDGKDRDHRVVGDSKQGNLGGFDDLPSHAIFDRGRLIGLWEYDPDSRAIAWATFSARKTKDLQATVDETEAFVRDQLEDARSVSLDSPKSRKPRIDAIRAMA